MAKKITTLSSNKWVSLMKIEKPENNIYGYIYSHETRCYGKIIAILPYRYYNGMWQYLLRSEVTPCWDTDRNIISSITGGYEKGMSIEDVVVMEMEEEAGYIINKNDLKNLGTCRGTKSSDTVYHLFTIDLTDKEKSTEGSGDGSELERKASCFWSDKINQSEDPLVYVMYHKIKVGNENG